MTKELNELVQNAGSDVYVAGAHSAEAEFAKIDEKFNASMAKLNAQNEIRSNIYNDLNNCHDIPKPIIRSILGQHFDTCFLVHGNTPELDKALLKLCQDHYNEVMEKL